MSACSGAVVTAGFQNSHVHFLGPQWLAIRDQPAAAVARSLEEMLLRFGFVTVVDIASDRDNTLVLRRRIESGEIRGPRILTAGLPLFPPNGLPIYIADLPRELLDILPQPQTVAAARRVVRENFERGSDVVKLFLVTPQGGGSVKRIGPEIAVAAVQEAHRRGKLVFAHPTDFDGIAAALDAGVDVLAHPALGAPTPWPDALLRRAVQARLSLIPSLQLLPYELAKENVPADVTERLIGEALEQVRAYAAAGGQLLFGTDVGYMTQYDPTAEYRLMARAGLTTAQILATLTTEPAARWRQTAQRGRLDVGLTADIVVLQADPASDAENFARVRCAFREGKTLFSVPPVAR